MPGCEQQQLVGCFQNVCLQRQKIPRVRFYRPSCAAKPKNPENQKQSAVEGDIKQLLICFHLLSPLTWKESLAARLWACRSSVHLSAGWLED